MKRWINIMKDFNENRRVEKMIKYILDFSDYYVICVVENELRLVGYKVYEDGFREEDRTHIYLKEIIDKKINNIKNKLSYSNEDKTLNKIMKSDKEIILGLKLVNMFNNNLDEYERKIFIDKYFYKLDFKECIKNSGVSKNVYYKNINEVTKKFKSIYCLDIYDKYGIIKELDIFTDDD